MNFAPWNTGSRIKAVVGHYGSGKTEFSLNMALAAKSLGLASRYLDVPNLYTNTPEGAGCKEMCGIPKDYDTVCFLCLGYSDDISEQPTPKRGDVVNYVD